MPEGDTLHKLAEAIRPHLLGHALRHVALRSDGYAPRLPGVVTERVEARGKHLVLTFDNGIALRTHLGMNGVWHAYAAADDHTAAAGAWTRSFRRPRSALVCEVATRRVRLMCFDAPQVQLARAREVERSLAAKVGPDLADRTCDLDAVCRRARQVAAYHNTVGELLLDQRVAAGVGNVFKSEILFLEGIAPSVAPATLTAEALSRIYARAAELVAHNTRRARRVTVAHGERFGLRRLYVYNRKGRPCLRCGTPIARIAQGTQLRATFYCPRCQASPGASAALPARG